MRLQPANGPKFSSTPGPASSSALPPDRDAPGKLIYFDQMAREAICKMEIEKSLREVSLQMSRIRQAQRLEVGMRLQDVLVRCLSLTSAQAALTPQSTRVLGSQDRDQDQG